MASRSIDKTRIEEVCSLYKLNFSDLFYFKQDDDGEWIVDVYNNFRSSQSHNKEGLAKIIEETKPHIKTNLELYSNDISIREKWVYIENKMAKLLTELN